MESADLPGFLIAAFLVCGLAAVVWEIVVRDPGSLGELSSDVRRFAGRPVRRTVAAAPPVPAALRRRSAPGCARSSPGRG